MAELTYEDVRRAVQTAAGNLQTLVSDIRNNLQTTRTHISRLNSTDVQTRLVNIERSLLDLNQFMQRIDINLQNTQPLAIALQQNQQHLLRMEQRLANLEQLTTDMSNYMQVMHQTATRLTEVHNRMFGRAEP
jgi:hypothetical protein